MFEYRQSRLPYLFCGNLAQIEQPVVIRAQHGHVVQRVRPAGLPADDVRDIAWSLSPATQRAPVMELPADDGPERFRAGVLAVTRTTAGHQLRMSCLAANGITVDVAAVSCLPDRDAHACRADTKFPGQGCLGLARRIPEATLRSNRLSQLLRSTRAFPAGALPRGQVRDRLFASCAGTGDPVFARPGWMILLVSKLAGVAAKFSAIPFRAARQPGNRPSALQALFARNEIAVSIVTLAAAVFSVFACLDARAPGDRFSTGYAGFARDCADAWHDLSIQGVSQ